MTNRWGNSGNSYRLFSWAPKSLQMVTAAMKLKDACSLEEKLRQPRQHIKKHKPYFADKGLCSQSYSVFVCGCESRTIKKAECRRIDAFELWLEKILESPLDSKEIKPVHPKGD